VLVLISKINNFLDPILIFVKQPADNMIRPKYLFDFAPYFVKVRAIKILVEDDPYRLCEPL
jgi:hypothetical protein